METKIKIEMRIVDPISKELEKEINRIAEQFEKRIFKLGDDNHFGVVGFDRIKGILKK